MRSFDGQFSDNRPLKRTREEKDAPARRAEGDHGTMKPHTSPELRVSIAGKIKELEADLAAPPPPPRERRCPRISRTSTAPARARRAGRARHARGSKQIAGARAPGRVSLL